MIYQLKISFPKRNLYTNIIQISDYQNEYLTSEDGFILGFNQDLFQKRCAMIEFCLIMKGKTRAFDLKEKNQIVKSKLWHAAYGKAKSPSFLRF